MGWRNISFLFLSYLFVGCITFSHSLDYECPHPEDVYPCYCEEEDGDPWLHCNHMHKADMIYDSMKGLNGYRIFKMSSFMNRILEPIKSDGFKGLAIERIAYENSTITINPPQFEGMEQHLISIQMRACFNKTNPLGSWDLGHLTKLKELIFDKNRIMRLPDDWLTSVPDSLKTLSLDGNNIVTIEDNALAKAKSVIFMILDGNRLTGLKRSMFPDPAENLRSLSLNDNRLRYLPYDLFENMPNLRIVEMTNNRLTTLEESIWSVMWSQLSKLDLTDNPLECDRSMKWMYQGQGKPILLYGDCQAPEKLKHKALKQLKLTDFD